MQSTFKPYAKQCYIMDRHLSAQPLRWRSFDFTGILGGSPANRCTTLSQTKTGRCTENKVKRPRDPLGKHSSHGAKLPRRRHPAKLQTRPGPVWALPLILSSWDAGAHPRTSGLIRGRRGSSGDAQARPETPGHFHTLTKSAADG